jgi:hypothetical protein
MLWRFLCSDSAAALSQQCQEVLQPRRLWSSTGARPHLRAEHLGCERRAATAKIGRGSAYVSEGRLLRRVVAQRLQNGRPAQRSRLRQPSSIVETASAVARDRVRNTAPNFVAGPRTFSAAAPEACVEFGRLTSCYRRIRGPKRVGKKGRADGASKLCSHVEDCRSTRRRRTVVCSRKKATETGALDRLQSREALKNCCRPDERPIAVGRSAKQGTPRRL